MSMPQGAMQSLTMLQAALQAASPQVTEPTVLGTPGEGGPTPMVPGGTGPASLGAAAGGLVRGMTNRGGGINPAQDELERSLLGGTIDLPEELLDAGDQYAADARTYSHTLSRRFRGNLGGAEAIFDLVRGRKAHKDMLESRNDLRQKQIEYKQAQEQALVEKEMKWRQEYVKNLLPQYIANNPGISHQAAVKFLTQAAAQKMPVDKVLPSGPVKPVAEKYIDPETKAEMTRFRNPVSGQIMTGEQWEPFISKGPDAKTTGATATPKQMLTYDDDGNEYQTTYVPVPDANGELPILGRQATGKNIETKPFSAMSPENKKYGSMVSNATTLVANSLPLMFDQDTGNWNSHLVIIPGSEEKAAYLAYRNAVRQSIRPESGAAVPEAEVEAAEMMYLPGLTDSDLTAQKKVQRFAEYQKRMYTTMFEGYRDVPENLSFVDYMQPWMGTPAAQAAAVDIDLDDRVDQAMAKYAQWKQSQED